MNLWLTQARVQPTSWSNRCDAVLRRCTITVFSVTKVAVHFDETLGAAYRAYSKLAMPFRRSVPAAVNEFISSDQ